jgi:hypothetical protein
MLLQLKCNSCSAFIVLHVNVSQEASDVPERVKLMNASSGMSLTKEEMGTLRSALTAYDGSFEKMFKATETERP